MAKLDFKKAFKYPFNRPKGLLNILWILLPIIGWFAIGGYSIRIVQEFCKGKFKKLPIFKFKSDLKLGFFMFLKALPFVIVYAIFISVVGLVVEVLGLNEGVLSLVDLLLQLLIVPMLTINFFNKQTIESFFEFRIIKSVFNNFGDYLLALGQSILLGIIFLIMIIVLVGIPAGAFTKNIFLADFYRRRVK
ncbi:MAG: DUF4013 domain-containing protein [archaeon]